VLIKPGAAAIERLVRLALEEDAPWGDLSAQAFLQEGATVEAKLVAREPGVLCGEDVFRAAMVLTGDIAVRFASHDADTLTKGEILAVVSGPARAVLQAERVALNFVQRLSGIATLTARYVAEVVGTRARITDTRKTTPGLRLLERYAVRCGGGHNHRFSLSDAVMLKDNHLALLARQSHQTLAEAIEAGRTRLPHTTHIEVEVDTLDQIEAVLAARIDTLMLDNFTTTDLREGVRRVGGRALVEASGGITLERIREIAATGVDLISVGALTHSARALDLGLDIEIP
jgi:nicotinate-nucleotide pyrophosphorylase (carboxylating)